MFVAFEALKRAVFDEKSEVQILGLPEHDGPADSRCESGTQRRKDLKVEGLQGQEKDWPVELKPNPKVLDIKPLPPAQAKGSDAMPPVFRCHNHFEGGTGPTF